MDIFNNDHEVLTVGHLTIENQLGKVIIHGDIELGADEVGQAQATMLRDFFVQLCTKITTTNLMPPSTDEGELIDNPFG